MPQKKKKKGHVIELHSKSTFKLQYTNMELNNNVYISSLNARRNEPCYEQTLCRLS
jgi:hypothetical protein